MSSIAKRSDGRWRARYRDAANHEHSRHFDRKVDAQRWLDEVTASVVSGSYVDPRAGQITVAEWAPRWIATKVDLKLTTLATYEALLSKHVLPRWGHMRLSDISYEAVAAWVAALTKAGLSGASVRHIYRVFSLMMGMAVRDGRLARNPASDVPLPRAAKGRQRFLTHGQVDQLAEAAGDYRLLIYFLAYTGVRFGEAAALRVGRVDLVRRRAVILEGMAEVRGVAVFSSPKNHQQRSVPIPRFLASELEAHLAGKDGDEFVFPAPKGGVLRLQNFRPTTFKQAVRRSGLPWVTPHDLRHTAASLAIAAGANVKVVQTMLGHMSATMTLDLYGHLFADQLDDVADALDLARGAATDRRTDHPA